MGLGEQTAISTLVDVGGSWNGARRGRDSPLLPAIIIPSSDSWLDNQPHSTWHIAMDSQQSSQEHDPTKYGHELRSIYYSSSKRPPVLGSATTNMLVNVADRLIQVIRH